MLKYFLKKLLQGVITLFVIITLVFVLMRMLPKENYFTESQQTKLNNVQKQEILKASGLLDPVPVQLVRFYKNILQGDFGVSKKISVGTPVTKLISKRMITSFKFGIISFFVSIVLGVALGIFQTLHKDRFGDHAGMAYTIFANAVPSIVSFSLILIIGMSVFKLPSLYSPRVHPVLSSIMPIICLSMSSIAGYALWTRRYMVDELNKDYIVLAKLKGLSSRQVMIRHVMRNALVPMVQFIPSSILLTIGGAFLTETFFGIPGMGPLLTNAISLYDVDVVQTLVILYASLGILGVILGDVLMSIVDPRISLNKEDEVR